ncbi:MAG: CopG family ribbon-helix-helix protein [Pseudomarimonas sp.]
MGVTSVRLQPEIEESLDALAQKLHRSKGWIINQSLREFIGREKQAAIRWQGTLSALESVAQGRLVSETAVHEWLESWGGDVEKAPPSPGQ